MKINFNSITVRTTLHIMLFTLTFIFFVTFVVKSLFTDSYMELEKDKVALISDNITEPLGLNISYSFDKAITEIANKALLDKNVLLVKISDDLQKKEYGFSDYSLSLEDHKKNHELINIQELLDPATEAKVGTLTIVYSNDSYEEYMNNFNVWFFWGILGFAFSLLVLTYFLYKSLKNLSILDKSLKNFNPQKPEKLNLITATRDEVFSISQSANIMIEKIIEFLDNTKKLNAQLFLSQGHLKDAQRMAKVGSFEYNVVRDELALSDEYYRILGIKKSLKFTWDEFLNLISLDDMQRVKDILNTAITNGSKFSIKYKLSLANNRDIYILTKGKVRNKKDTDTKITAISMDITNDVQNKKIIEQLAYFDSLTGLANRTLLKDRMLKSIQKAERTEEKMGIIFLDLDHFKLINDTLGHGVGDELLIYISNILKAQTRNSDTVSRLGGDEFVILLPSIKKLEDVEKFASKIQKALEHKHNIGTHQLYITSSIGVTVYPEHGDTCDELIRNADTAMYEAKNDGRNRYKIYSETMGNFVDKQLNLEQDLTEAVKTKEQIQVYYQVKVDAQTKNILGAEALVRWNHPKNGLIFPDEFIYMAESTGLMIELGNIITDQSIAMVKELNKIGFIGSKMAINLSARQFQDTSLVPFISQTLKKHEIDPSQIEFEITESISMSNMTNTMRILQELKELGVSIAIDDFGTGHSSLAYLKKFPIDTLKIDRSFVTHIVEDDEDRIIAQTIISMAHSLGLKTVAEGIETQEHVDILQNMKCDLLQGYFYSKPIDKDTFVKFIQEYKINN